MDRQSNDAEDRHVLDHLFAEPDYETCVGNDCTCHTEAKHHLDIQGIGFEAYGLVLVIRSDVPVVSESRDGQEDGEGYKNTRYERENTNTIILRTSCWVFDGYMWNNRTSPSRRLVTFQDRMAVLRVVGN